MLLNSPEIRKLETSFLLLFERTLFKGIKGRPAPSYLKAVPTQFKSKTFLKQVDKIIDEIYLQSIKFTNKRIKKNSSASVIKKNDSIKSNSKEGELYNHRYAAAALKSLPITEEAVRQASGLAKEVTESTVRILKDDGIYLEHPDKLEKRIRDLWGGQKYKAVRFTRTFIADVATNTALYRYSQTDMDLQFYAKLDDKTSPQCRMLHGTIFKANSQEAKQYRPPTHPHCRSDLIPVPITRNVDPKMRFENRDFSRPMDQKFDPLNNQVDKNLVKKTFKDIGKFNEKYRIDQFILDEDVEARLMKLNVRIETELPKIQTKTKIKPEKTTEKIIRDFEAKIKARKTEKAYVFDANGNILLEKGGTKNKVSFTNEEVKQFKGAILTHNHPGASSFSMQDIQTACMNFVKEIRATGTFRTYVMRMKDGSNLYPDLWKDKIRNAYMLHNAEVRRDFMSRINKGKLSIQDAELLHFHEVWTRTAKDILGLDYSFIEEKP